MLETRAVFAAHLEQELPDIVAVVLQRLRSEVRAYRDLTGPQLHDVEAIASWVLRRLLESWSAGEDGSMNADDRARIRAIAAARAADGRPLADVLRAYRIVAVAFVQHLAQQHLNELSRRDLADLSIGVLNGIDSIAEEIIDAYNATRERLSSDLDRARATLLDDLINGRHSSPGALADRARELHFDPPQRAWLLVAQSVGTGPSSASNSLERLVASLALTANTSGQVGHLATRRGNRLIVLLPMALEPADIEKACAAISLVGCLIGGPIESISTTFRLAVDALDTAPEHAYDERFVLDEGDAQLLALLTARPTADTEAVVSSVLGPLNDPRHAHLVDGIAAFIVAGTAAEAASRLHLHAQTLRYRLRRVHELTGRDPRSSWNRLALDTALQLRDLQRHRSPSP
ncbi:PucR family transcriptional regulator [Gordonia lacunae]|uniref:PucR family transcriptional regulator n=1 Tax=Gordonia lacunae TaxID=417102 RepID=UPI0039E70E72